MAHTHYEMKNIEILLMDVDGVLTDGSIIYHDNGSETKVFNVKDGLGLRMLMDAGIEVGIITGRCSEALKHRCRNLGIDHLYDAVSEKTEALNDILKRTEKTPDQAAFIGDDLPDLKLMKTIGFSIAVADAHPLLKEQADMVTSAKGGEGAVREACETILKAKGLWEKTLERYI